MGLRALVRSAFAAALAVGSPTAHAEEPAPASAEALDVALTRIHGRRLDLQRGAMLTLGTWALVNVGVGLWGDLLREDEGGSERYVHQMNWLWGSVNGVIAGVGLAQALSDRPEAHGGYRASLDRARTTEIIYLVNGVLDLSYLATGAWLWERGLRTDDRRLEGYGQSLLLQGGFLLAFDGVLFALSRALVTSDLEALPVELVPTLGGAALTGRF